MQMCFACSSCSCAPTTDTAPAGQLGPPVYIGPASICPSNCPPSRQVIAARPTTRNEAATPQQIADTRHTSTCACSRVGPLAQVLLRLHRRGDEIAMLQVLEVRGYRPNLNRRARTGAPDARDGPVGRASHASRWLVDTIGQVLKAHRHKSRPH